MNINICNTPSSTKRQRWVAIGAALFTILSAGAMKAKAQETNGQTQSSGVGELSLKPCFVKGVKPQVECGQWPIQIGDVAAALNVVRIPAKNKQTEAAPIFIFAGGPGQAATELAGNVGPLLGKLNHHHDVVMVDQRGTGGTMPLQCEFDWRDPDAAAFTLNQCLKEHQTLFPFMRTLDYAHDINLVRQGLGYHKMIAWGGSYGTRTAQMYARQFPQHLEKMILDGVAPNQASIPLMGERYAMPALKALEQQCELQAFCKSQYGSIIESYRSLLSVLPKASAANDQDEPPFNQEIMRSLVRTMLYSPNMAAMLPMMMEQTHQDAPTGFEGILNIISDDTESGMYLGMTGAVMCQEDFYPGVAARSIEVIATSLMQGEYYRFWRDACKGLNAAEAPKYLNTEPMDTPTLLISGALDPITPSAAAELAMTYLPNSQHIVLQTGGHIGSSNACVQAITQQFVNNKPLNTECLDKQVMMPFSLYKDSDNDLF